MNILEKILKQKRQEVALLRPRRVTPKDLRAMLQKRGDLRSFTAALKKPRTGSIALIAEIKRASPSAGVIRRDFDPARIAREYEAAGASALSVLTDEKFFHGSNQHLREARQAVKLPLLRKDFIIDARQILEALEWGADAILLIAAILSDDELKLLHALATEAGVPVLVEIHDETEMERGLAIGARLIGINNRDLKTFNVDLATTERLAGRLRTVSGREDLTLVAESGVHTRADIERLVRCGAKAVLVGESLLRHGNITAKVAELLGTVNPQ